MEDTTCTNVANVLSLLLTMTLKINWDYLGIGTSVACAIHCALLPVVLTSLPLFGINIIHNSFFEWGMITIAFLVGCYALVHGYIKHHRNKLPFLIFTAGFLFLILKQFIAPAEYIFLFFAVSLIISAHYINFRYCRASRTCTSSHHKH
jgi:hypothetical protein